MSAAVFLDRDGVLNAKAAEGRYVTSPGELEMLPGVATALAELRARDPDVRLIVVTNQRGVALGHLTDNVLGQIHGALRRALDEADVALDGIYACPHERDGCACRKPLTGLFEQAVADFPDIEPSRSAMVGDSLADLEAGVRFGCRSYLVGDPDSRVQVRAAAKAKGLPISGEADSLSALVRSQSLVGEALAAPRSRVVAG